MSWSLTGMQFIPQSPVTRSIHPFLLTPTDPWASAPRWPSPSPDRTRQPSAPPSTPAPSASLRHGIPEWSVDQWNFFTNYFAFFKRIFPLKKYITQISDSSKKMHLSKKKEEIKWKLQHQSVYKNIDIQIYNIKMPEKKNDCKKVNNVYLWKGQCVWQKVESVKKSYQAWLCSKKLV